MSEITEVENIISDASIARVRTSKQSGNKFCRQRRRNLLTGVTSTV